MIYYYIVSVTNTTACLLDMSTVEGRSFLITSTFRTYYSRLVTIRITFRKIKA